MDRGTRGPCATRRSIPEGSWDSELGLAFTPDGDINDSDSDDKSGFDEEFDLELDDDWELDLGSKKGNDGDNDMESLAEIEEELRTFASDSAPLPEGELAELDEVDEDDPEALFDGNVAFDEYYRRGMDATDTDSFKRKEYTKGTETLIANTERMWERKTFIVPEILYDPSLLLSPHVFLLAILFRRHAFMLESLNDNPHMLSELHVHPSGNELPLSLKDEIKGRYIFRRCVKTSIGFSMSNQPISQGMMGGWVKRIGLLLGFERNTICYSLRYMAGNSLDQHGSISEALRNLVLDHAPSSDTFQKHYLNRNVCADLWAIHRAQEPQQELIAQATSHGSSRNSRRPIGLTRIQANALKNNPQYVRLTEQLSQVPKGPQWAEKRQKITNQRRALMGKLRDNEVKRIREEWTHKQAVEDIERQIQGNPGDFEPSAARVCPPMSTAQQQMFEALQAPLVNDLSAQFQRRTTAVLAVATYCRVEEPLNMSNQMWCKPAVRRPPPPPEIDSELNALDRARKLRNSVFGQVGQVRRCFVCVWKALTLSSSDENLPSLTPEFYNNNSLTRHFIRTHLDPMDDDAVADYPICVPVVRLNSKMHLRNHAETAHGLRSYFLK
ncbi:hypothetical protein INS49_005055 [Diaporthe citri]|uniref:uncharacterized protein n=1 Tax=Diaporthe citri TaxID=83186 RepID=UPI001C7E400C|nr:uncharacterized protein INS49_005055 [Diaporthe citri]KAG6354084.1 hypothetical protein INS49_005055 [Diaporthe citri]